VKRTTRWGGLAVLLGAAIGVAAVAGATGGNAANRCEEADRNRVAFDSSGNMAPFDNPALAAAKIRVKQINAKGGVVGGRHLVIKTCNTQGNNPTTAKACAVSLLGQGSNIIFTTCDVDYATPGRAGGDQPRRARRGAVHRHGSDGAEALRCEREARVQLRQRCSGRGLGDGPVGLEPGWKSAALATNTYLVYFKNVVQAFDKRFRQLGGKIVDRESYATGANNVKARSAR
jgi:branched-chain amino acid transport system substrate-binding protein